MIIYKKDVPLYFGELVVIINDDFKEVEKKFKIDIGSNLDGSIGFYFSMVHKKTGRTRRVILLTTTPTHSTIAHESLHCCNRILDDICHTYDLINDEPAAYLLDWIIEQVYTTCKKNNIEVCIK